MVSICRFVVVGALVMLLPALAYGKTVTSSGELEPADFWAWIEGTDGALPRVEARDAVPVSVGLENPLIGGHVLEGHLTASNERLPTGPATSVNGSIRGNVPEPLSTRISLASLVTFDVAALSATAGSAPIRILGRGIGGADGFVAFSSGWVTLYSTNASGQISGVVDSWEIPDTFTATPIDDIVVLTTNELYRIIVRSTAEIVLSGTTNVDHFAYMFVDPSLGTSTPDVELVVSANLPEALPEASGFTAAVIAALTLAALARRDAKRRLRHRRLPLSSSRSLCTASLRLRLVRAGGPASRARAVRLLPLQRPPLRVPPR